MIDQIDQIENYCLYSVVYLFILAFISGGLHYYPLPQLERDLEESAAERRSMEEKMVALEEEKRKISLHLDEFISESAALKDQVCV